MYSESCICLAQELRQHTARQPTLAASHLHHDDPLPWEYEYEDEDGELWIKATKRDAAPRPENRSTKRIPRARSASPAAIFDTESSHKWLQSGLAAARRKIEELEAQIRQPPGCLDGIKESEHVDIKELRKHPLFILPNDHGQYRAWRQSVLHGMISYDNTGKMKEYLTMAMDLRGNAQQKLKFEKAPLDQAMGMLGAKFMHAGCFDHPYFGLLLETYSPECLAQRRNPSAPFILSVIAAHFDTSSGSAVTEKTSMPQGAQERTTSTSKTSSPKLTTSCPR